MRSRGSFFSPPRGRSCWRSRSLIVLMIFFSLASPELPADRQHRRHPAGDRGERRAGHRLHLRHHHRRHRSVGRHAHDVLRGHGRRVPDLLGIAAVRRASSAAIFFGALSGFVSGALIAKLKIPPFIATLGMMLVLKGLVAGDLRRPSRSISTTRPSFPQISQDSLIGYFLPTLPIPNAVLILFVRGDRGVQSCSTRPLLGRYTFALGSNEEAVRLSGVNVDRWKIVDLLAQRRHLRHRRSADRLAPEFGAAGARPGLRARRHRRGRHRRHFAQRRAPARFSAPSSAPSS